MPLKEHINIVAGFKNNKSYLEHCFHKQPFKIANVTEDKQEEVLRLMITSSSPGTLDNDNYFIEINVAGNASLHLTTQSYQRLFTMKKNACQHLNVHVGNKASFCFLPHPVVPHKEATFSATNTIYLHKKHNLIWSDIITCGRKLSGEQFLFTQYHNLTNIYIDQKLVVRENVMLEPFKKELSSMGQLEGYTHQSTLIFLHNLVDMKEIIKPAKQLLSGAEDIIFGISLLPVNGLIFRQLGQKAEQLFNNNNKLAELIRQLTMNETKVLSTGLSLE